MRCFMRQSFRQGLLSFIRFICFGLVLVLVFALLFERLCLCFHVLKVQVRTGSSTPGYFWKCCLGPYVNLQMCKPCPAMPHCYVACCSTRVKRSHAWRRLPSKPIGDSVAHVNAMCGARVAVHVKEALHIHTYTCMRIGPLAVESM